MPLPPQCVERFHRYRSNEKSIIASLLKFAGYIHNHKILPENIFGRILKNKMAVRDVYSTLSKDFCWPSRAKGIIGRDSDSQDINLDWEYFWHHFEKQDGRHSHEKCLYLPYYWS